MTLVNNICMYCLRFHEADLQEETCDAFPNGIPNAIIMMEADHRKPYPGDHGLLFLVEPGSEDLLPPIEPRSR